MQHKRIRCNAMQFKLNATQINSLFSSRPASSCELMQLDEMRYNALLTPLVQHLLRVGCNEMRINTMRAVCHVWCNLMQCPAVVGGWVGCNVMRINVSNVWCNVFLLPACPTAVGGLNAMKCELKQCVAWWNVLLLSSSSTTCCGMDALHCAKTLTTGAAGCCRRAASKEASRKKKRARRGGRR